MGTDMKKVGRGNKVKTALCAAGGVASIFLLPSFIYLNIIVAIGLFVLAGKYFFGIMKDYAATGKRF